MAEIKAWNYHWHITEEEYERRKLIPDAFCAHNNSEWASLTLTQDGLFACVSDYGDYIKCWPEHCRVKGEDFREFVSRINADYLLGKTKKENWIEQDSTAPNLRKLVKELRECHNKHFAKPLGPYGVRETEWCNHGSFQHLDHDLHTAEWAKQCLALIDGNLSPQDLNELYYSLNLHFDGEDIHYTYSPQALTFGKYVLPQLQRMIKEELAAEKAVAID